MLVINDHTWYGHYVHIGRKGGANWRIGKVGALHLGNGYVALSVSFHEDAKRKTSLYSPIFIMSLQCHWLNREFVSDSDSEYDNERGEFVLLPVLRVLDNINITSDEHRRLKWITSQTDMLLSLILTE